MNTHDFIIGKEVVVTSYFSGAINIAYMYMLLDIRYVFLKIMLSEILSKIASEAM